jgi:hypothetical protein
MSFDRSADVDFREGPAHRVVAHRPDGGWTAYGIVLTLLLTAASGIVVGTAAGWVGQSFYFVLIFPLFIGMAVGFLSAFGVTWGNLRNPIIAGLLGALGGGVATVAEHHAEYRFYLAEVGQAMPGAWEWRFSPTGFASYIDARARQGVEVGRNSSTMNLGYWGSYLLWIAELGIAAGLSAAVASTAAKRPFCAACNRWKGVRQLAQLDSVRRATVETILATRVFRASGQTLDSLAGLMSVEVAECPNCGPEGTIEVRVVDTVVNSQGRTEKRELAHVSFPGDMLEESEATFHGEPAESTAVATRPLAVTPPVPRDEPPSSKPITYITLKTYAFWRSQTWELEVHRDHLKLIDALGNPLAAIPRVGGSSRIVFPAFLANVAQLGILGDDGVVRWFKRDKEAIRRIRNYLSE